MNTIKLKYGREEIISRIPGLFPYIEFDENHVSTVHSASDSSCGCYGKVVCGLVIPNEEKYNLNVDGQAIIKCGTQYTYNTLMRAYYTYRDVYPTHDFIKFMEGGIGRFKIVDLIDFNHTEWTLVPEYEYYANAARLYDEYVKIQKMCQAYETIKQSTGENDCELECLLDKYRHMGGDTMLAFYQARAGEAVGIADTYRDYASNSGLPNEGDFGINVDINIVSSSNDLGILNTFLDFFDPKREYSPNNEVIYEDRTWICTEAHTGPWNASHFRKLSDPNMDTYDLRHTYKKGEKVLHQGILYKCKVNSYRGYWNESNFEKIKMTGKTDSKLSRFRNNANYIDAGGSIQRPRNGVDWLWYYHVGDVVFQETTTDNLNNIETISGGHQGVGAVDKNLMAYGDVIENITRNTNDKTITFAYVIGAHLKAKVASITRDDDGNSIYRYEDFAYDNEDIQHGVRYTETYSYPEGGEIDKLGNNEFNSYVTYKERPVIYTYHKCEFDTSSASCVSEVEVNGITAEINYIVGGYEVNYNEESDILCSSLTKLDYMTGIPYKPTVENDVSVKRGNAAAWERHIRLGEIRTFEDLTTYHNGGFFNLR